MKIAGYNVTPKNVRSFIVGNINKYAEDLGFQFLECYEQEQVLLRDIICIKCSLNGRCLNQECKCITPNMYYDQSKECESGRFTGMMDEDQYNHFLTNYVENCVTNNKTITLIDMAEQYMEANGKEDKQEMNLPEDFPYTEEQVKEITERTGVDVNNHLGIIEAGKGMNQ
jgi:hypothetical protein